MDTNLTSRHIMEHQRSGPLLDPAFITGLIVAAVCWAVWLYPEKPLFGLLRQIIPSRRDIAVLHRLAGVGAAWTFTYTVVGWLLSRRLKPNSTPREFRAPLPIHSLEALAVAILVGIALALRLHGLTREFSYDELFSAHWFITHDGSWWDTAASYRIFNNHILFSLLGRLAWLTIGHGSHDGGPAEWIIRLPALMCGLAGVYLVWQCGREWVGRAPAVLASFLLAILPIHVQQSQSARGYAGVLACSLVSSWALLRLLERPGWMGVATVVASGAAAIYFHLYGVWVWVVQVIVVAAVAVSALVPGRAPHIGRKSFVRAWLALLGVGVTSVLLYLPVIFQMMRVVEERGHSDPDPAFPHAVALELFGVDGLRLAVVLTLIATGAVVGPLRRGRMIGYFVGLLVLPFVVMWRIVYPTDLYARFFCYWLPYAMLMLACGLLAVWRAWPLAPRIVRIGGRTVAAGLAVGLLATWLGQSATPIPISSGYRAALAALEEGAPRDMPVCAFGADADLFKFYENRLRVIHSESEFAQFSGHAQNFGCVYHDLDWSQPWEKALATRLAATSRAREFANVRVFRSRSERQ